MVVWFCQDILDCPGEYDLAGLGSSETCLEDALENVGQVYLAKIEAQGDVEVL
jgi:hypothetical protein